MSVDQQAMQPRQTGNIARNFQRFFTQGHVALYRFTSGIIGSRAAGRSILILTTLGRKSGKERDTPLLYFPDGEHLIVIASNGGAPKHPTWWLNLQANPQAKAQIRGRTIAITARQATPDESKRLWSIIASKYQNFVDYQKSTTREIPIVILTPDI